MTNPTKLLRSREIPFNYEIDGNASLTVLTFHVMGKSHEKPNPLPYEGRGKIQNLSPFRREI
ncbi:MAG: hypothetical protein HWQ35_06065 [Nostoc sp. NMS1]|uniref:hypothetical protein n=1 Tax=unclassified Nostoc TaxID=2593658 RepID=UPI0025DD82B2|nr:MULTISPECIES: hypothetical protein [unclassified Nostoc]MBN3906128.1 hypothetical protein [Nostoc sp. NMS1]MBN3992355.1 hypothetical protein [Nostoc sp. NMS2]